MTTKYIIKKPITMQTSIRTELNEFSSNITLIKIDFKTLTPEYKMIKTSDIPYNALQPRISLDIF